MDLLDKVTNWLWIALAAIVGAIWTEVRSMKKDLSQTREDMSTRTEHLALAAIVANTRETRVTREELISAIKDFKQDTDDRLDRIADQMARTEDKLIESEGKTSKFRHEIRNEVNVLALNTRIIGMKVGVKFPARDDE